MKITKIETFHVEPRWLMVKVSTDTGCEGWGEPIVEGRARTVETAVHELGEYLVGEDPRRIEHHWQAIYRGSFYRGGPVLMSALSGIEQALWDIKGKDLGVPAYELLGGRVRDSVLMYAHAHGSDVDGLAAAAREKVARGFTALKLSTSFPAWPLETPAFVENEVARVAAVREAVGSAVNIAVDFHGRVGPALAGILIRELEPYGLMFIEEPCLPENVGSMIELSRKTTTPLATGERLFTRWAFRELLENNAVAVVQPDLCHVGGIFEARKIAAMAETYFMSVAPHNPLGPLSLAACIQLDACTPNFLIQEHPTLDDGSDLGVGLLVDPFVIESGGIAITDKPGLGVDVDEDAVRAKVYDGSWQTPTLRHTDGSVADW